METKNTNIWLQPIIYLTAGLVVGWLLWGNRPLPMAHRMSDGSMMRDEGTSMGDMMSDMNHTLSISTDTEFDQVFLKEMIVHHEGAIEMAKLVLERSKEPKLIKLANDIIAAQTAEIAQMEDWSKNGFK